MIEVLRRSLVLRLGGRRTVSLARVRRPARTLSLSAEAVIEGEGGRSARKTTGQTAGQSAGGTTEQATGQGAGSIAAIVFGPENGAVSETLVFEAAREAYAKSYAHLYVAGFAIQPNARRLIEDCERAIEVPATYVQASMDLMMGDLLKEPAVEPGLLGVWPAGRADQAGGDGGIGGTQGGKDFGGNDSPGRDGDTGGVSRAGGNAELPGRAARPRRVRSRGDGLRPPGGARCPGPVPRHGL